MGGGGAAHKDDRRGALRALNNMEDTSMTLLRRTCSTCCSYSGGECLNMVSFIVPGSDSREPLPNEVCDDHMTHEEDRAEDAAIGTFWLTLGIAPRLGLPDDLDGPTGA